MYCGRRSRQPAADAAPCKITRAAAAAAAAAVLAGRSCSRTSPRRAWPGDERSRGRGPRQRRVRGTGTWAGPGRVSKERAGPAESGLTDWGRSGRVRPPREAPRRAAARQSVSPGLIRAGPGAHCLAGWRRRSQALTLEAKRSVLSVS
jgi:hypothetical protein